MSRGLGRIQRECLRVIESYEKAGKEPTTYHITTKVYQVKPDQRGKRVINAAQHTAVKRALAGLRRKGLVAGAQDISFTADGQKILARSQWPTSHRAERCCFWSIVTGNNWEQRKTA